MSQVISPFQIIYDFGVGGISQQPSHLRFQNQVEDAVNALFNVADGVSKRPGSRWLSAIDSINAVSFEDADWTASSKTITKTGAFTSYTHTDNDYVFIRLAGPVVNWGLYKIASKTDADNIVLTESIADNDQSGIIQSGWETDKNYRIHVIERDADERYLVIYGEGMVRVFDDRGRENIVRITNKARRYLFGWNKNIASAFGAGADADDIAMATSADFTIVVNRGVVPWADSSPDYTITAEFADIEAMYDAEGSHTNGNKFRVLAPGNGRPSGYYEYQQGAAVAPRLNCQWSGPLWLNFNRYNNLNAKSFRIILTESDGTEWNVAVNNLDVSGASNMSDVAQEFEDALSAALQALTSGAEVVSVDWDASDEPIRGRFIITSPFTGYGAAIDGVFQANSSNDEHWNLQLPFSSANAFGGRGQSGGELSVEEKYTRIEVPGQAGGRINKQHAPMALIRFSIGEEDSGEYYPGSWTLGEIDWNPRTSGSPASNPAPKIFTAEDQGGQDNEGIRIADVAFHRGRLVFAAGDRIVMSQAGDLFNFYLDDSTALIDSDPIEQTLSGNYVLQAEHIVPFRKSLLIFTKAGVQLELNAPEALTHSTATITQSTAYETIPAIRPKPIGDQLYFASARQDAAIVYEYAYDDTRVANFATDVTSHVKRLVPADIRSLVTSPNNQLVFITPLDCDQLFVYATWWQGNQKVQSAWTRFQFDDSYRIIDLGVIRNDLFMLVETGSTLHVEKIPIARQVL